MRTQRYYYPGLQVLLLGAVVGAVWLLLRRRAGRGSWLAYAGYVVLAGAYLYLLRPAPVGLVARPGAVLMAGPAAGGGVAEHRRRGRPPARAGPAGHLVPGALAGGHGLRAGRRPAGD